MGETHLLLDSKRGREGEREREGKQADSGWHASSCREVSPRKTNPGRRAGFSEAGTAKASQFHLRADIVALATAWPTDWGKQARDRVLLCTELRILPAHAARLRQGLREGMLGSVAVLLKHYGTYAHYNEFVSIKEVLSRTL